MLDTIHRSLTIKDKEFLLGFNNLIPDWNIYDFERFPAVKWKLQNLSQLKDNNPEKFKEPKSSLENLFK